MHLLSFFARFHTLKEELSQDYIDRFSGLGRLYGEAALPRLQAAHVAVIGIGGVGSWAAEALARSGIGKITLVDLDDVCVTNVNRQLPALQTEFGKSKVSVVAERLRLINPELEVHEVIKFFTEKTANEILEPAFDCVIDAIDQLEHKAFLIGTCFERKISIVASGGAGGKSNPASVSTDDLACASNDGLLKILRKMLRTDFGFPLEPTRTPFGIRAVYSKEKARYPWSDGSVRAEPEEGSRLRLNCDSGFGTSAQVTGTFGFAAAAEAVDCVLKLTPKPVWTSK